MKFVPILFSTPMVQAILEDRKTMTRRIADVPVGDHFGTDIMDWGLSKHPFQEEGQWFYKVQTAVDDFRTHHLPCKYQKGDVLWGRESFTNLNADFKTDPYFVFKAGMDHPDQHGPVTWKPSIHMPKSACRIFLEVLDVRVERLQEITEEDAKAEGATKLEGKWRLDQESDWHEYTHVAGFQNIWDHINGEESWKLNPWVWVVSFKRIDKPENFN